MMRFAARTSLLTFGVIALLIGTVLIASGAFRPVRFAVLNLRSNVGAGLYVDLILVSDTGDQIQLVGQKDRAGPPIARSNRLAWTDTSASLMIWEHGQRTPVGSLYNTPRWSAEGLLAWSGLTEHGRSLMLWDDAGTRRIDTRTGDVWPWAWVANELWWIQHDTETLWKLMRWNGQQVDELYTSTQLLTDTRFFSCAAVRLNIDGTDMLYRAGELLLIPAAANAPMILQSDNCQTIAIGQFINNRLTPTVLWDGETQTSLPFPVYGMRNNDELLGVQRPENDSDSLTFYFMRADTMIEQTWVSEQNETGVPSLLFWDDEFSCWYLPLQSGPIFLCWNPQTQVFQQFPLPSTEQAFHFDSTRHRAAWMQPLEAGALQVMLWEDEQLTGYTLRFPELPQNATIDQITMMNDGTLLLTFIQTFAAGQVQTFVYQWDGQTVESLAVLPAYTTVVSDWMMWE